METGTDRPGPLSIYILRSFSRISTRLKKISMKDYSPVLHLSGTQILQKSMILTKRPKIAISRFLESTDWTLHIRAYTVGIFPPISGSLPLTTLKVNYFELICWKNYVKYSKFFSSNKRVEKKCVIRGKSFLAPQIFREKALLASIKKFTELPEALFNHSEFNILWQTRAHIFFLFSAYFRIIMR